MTNKTIGQINRHYFILTENKNKIFKISFDEDGYMDPSESKLFGYNESYAFNIILGRALTNNNPHTIIPFDPEEIGLNIEQIYLALGILTLKKSKSDILFKYFNFYPKLVYESYFQLYKPDFDRLLKDVVKNKINNFIATVLTINEHVALFLFYNNKIYLLDYSLFFVTDDHQDKAKQLVIELKEYIKTNNYNLKIIYNILESCFNNNGELKTELIKKKINDDKLYMIMNKLLVLEKMNLEEKTMKLDENYFFNKDLSEKVIILNRFSLQGLNACSYYCLASYKLILDNNYKIEDIILLCNNGIFQIKVILIILKDFLKDNQNIIIIDSNITSEYNIYKKDNIIIGIKKFYHNIEIPFRKKENLSDLNLEKIVDIKNVKNMLNELGYNKL